MIKPHHRKRALLMGAGGTLAGLAFAAGPAMAAPTPPTPPTPPSAPAPPTAPGTPSTSGANGPGAVTDPSNCQDPQLSQPFLASGDENLYTLVPGESLDSFTGGGWSLSGGASIVRSPLASGGNGDVLQLAAGASAVSPYVCVEANYSAARTMISTPPNGNVAVQVSYAGVIQGSSTIQGDGAGWTLSDPFAVDPAATSGWQLAQFQFTNSGPGMAKIYDFYVDPHMSD